MRRSNLSVTGRPGRVAASLALVATALITLRPGVAPALRAQSSPPSPPRSRVEYNRDVRPILSDNCFLCHGPDAKTRKGKLRLDRRDDAVRDRDGHAAVVPGNVEESELIARILSDDALDQMPPPSAHKTLTAAQKDILKRWVAQGAEYQAHWAYLPPVRPVVPALPDSSKVRNPIDAFIQKTLLDEKLAPSPEADRRTLIRRLSLDLVGLPPTPEEVSAFLADNSPRAYEDLVDRLLASPRYGERMAIPWLDVARYADTVGFHGDQNQNAWAYRDYVIKAFNDDKPFDQFTREQLAGDLLPNPTPEQLAATCFNRLNMMTREGGAQPKEYIAKYTADRIRTVGMAWLGSTLNCCECHDHKFDPFTMKDFYSLGAFFADMKQWGVYADYGYTPNPDLPGWTNDHPWPPEIVVDSPALAKRIGELKAEQARVVASRVPSGGAYEAWRRELAVFLKAHPDGWETPGPTVKAGNVAPRPARRAAAKKAAPVAPQRKANPPAQPDVEDDARIVFNGTVATTDEIELAPTPGWLAAVRVEVLPDPSHRDRIVRLGDRANVRPSFLVVDAAGKTRPLAIRHAQADRYTPRYANGFEILGVQGTWLTDRSAVDRAHSAVYFLDRPVRLAPGERLRLRIPDNTAGALRISTSPLAPLDAQHPGFPRSLADSLNDEATAHAYYLRSTAWNTEGYAAIKTLDNEILACHDGKTPVMVTERTNKPLTIRVLKRGNWMDETGEICKPATPAFLPQLSGTGDRTLTRLDLANWLCSADNPLTTRVVVNRLWKQFFGTGLSAQIDDLGAQGESPSHPELLDWLAVEFRERGWHIKPIVKQIVMSHTYRQDSKPRPEVRDSDPNNRLLASQNPRRLEAEIVRDNALAIAGLIHHDLGGPPSHPYQPGGYYEGLQFPDRDYIPERDSRQYRRGVYGHWQRTFLHPMMANFDAPSREDCIALRTAANSPQQALTLLNDPAFVEAARVWAARLLSSTSSDPARVDRIFEQALARPPREKERASLLTFLDRARAEYRQRPDDARKLEGVGHAPAPAALDPVELAAWTTVCRVVLNLHETITRY
ncbi:MAG: PSD1 and planctomycete cytochrome C domain-containing protein [Isosphaeraceae bacterium]